jgi:hypothetical protein
MEHISPCKVDFTLTLPVAQRYVWNALEIELLVFCESVCYLPKIDKLQRPFSEEVNF